MEVLVFSIILAFRVNVGILQKGVLLSLRVDDATQILTIDVVLWGFRTVSIHELTA